MSTETTGRRLVENEKKKIDFSSWTIIFLTFALALFLSFSRDTFLSFGNIHSILYDVSINFFAIIGFTLLIITGELDMSVGSMFGLGGALLGQFVFTYKMSSGIAILLAVVIAGAIGLLVGFLITKFKLNSMMVTIGVMMAVKGYNWIMINKFSGRQLGLKDRQFISIDIMGIKWTIIVMVCLAIVFEIFLAKSKHLKQLYYIGHNMETTMIYGLNATRVKMICFALSAGLSALGGALMTARLNHPHVSVGAGLEVSMITAAVISGASIFGGRGSMVRSMFGLLFIAVLQNGMTAFNVDSYIQQVIIGVILIISIYMDIRVNKKKA